MSQVVEAGPMEMGCRVVELECRARSLRAKVLARAVGAPWRWLRIRVERLRAPIDFEPV